MPAVQYVVCLSDHVLIDDLAVSVLTLELYGPFSSKFSSEFSDIVRDRVDRRAPKS